MIATVTAAVPNMADKRTAIRCLSRDLMAFASASRYVTTSSLQANFTLPGRARGQSSMSSSVLSRFVGVSSRLSMLDAEPHGERGF